MSDTVGIPLELKGHYHWIVFPSNRSNRAGAMNRYFGLMTDGKMKVRGIELRRRDTPGYVRHLQRDMLDQMKYARTVDELYSNLPSVLDAVRRYADEILSGGVDPKELVFTTHTRHKLEDYKKYYDITLRAAGSLLRPFGYDRYVLDDVVMGSEQMHIEGF